MICHAGQVTGFYMKCDTDKRVKKVFSVAIQLETIEPLMTKKSTMSSVDDTDTKKINRQIKF